MVRSRRLDCLAFLRHSKTGQTNRLQLNLDGHALTGRSKTARAPPSSVHATPDLLRFAAGFRTPVQCAHHHSNLIRSAERDSDGFLKLESLDFFETPSPKHSLQKTAPEKTGVEFR